ncbi:MAG: LamG domain-containing protein [Akkermansiaceae bacterium]|nr:LamG domain-containing protein [Akkermansiaceae bacterium]
MKKHRFVYLAATFAMGWSVPASAEILVGLEAGTALYDSQQKDIVSDGNVQPPDNPSGVPVIDNAGEHPHSSGFTFNVSFTPAASDLTGTKTLIEIGGNSSGSGLYLIGGVPTLLSKQGAQATTHPESLNDATLPSIALQSAIGVLEAGVSYSFSASWNHAGTLELRVKQDGQVDDIFDPFVITGLPGNWSGNDTLSVKTLNTGNAGGLARDTTNAIDPRFNTNAAQVTSFAGVVHRAVFWNASDVTPAVLSEPEIKGFTITRLPSAGKLRFHWNISEGGLPNPTTAEIREGETPGGVLLHTIPEGSLVGFVDLETTAPGFILTATNATGTVQAAAAPQAETAHSAVVRGSNPLAWYRFNEAAGSRHLVDSAENAIPNNGTVRGETIAGGTGIIDGSGVFAGSTTVLNRQILNPGLVDAEVPKGFSVELIVKHYSAATIDNVIISQQDINGTGRQIISVRPDGTLFSVLGGTGHDSAAKLVPDSWNHVVFVVDPDRGQFRWYLNGKLADTITPSGGITLEGTEGGWVIGSAKNLTGNLFKGAIDEVAVFRDLLDDPDRDGDPADSRISSHHQAWYQLTKGILFFKGTASTVVTGTPLDLLALVGADVTSVTIDNGIGTVPIDADRNANVLAVLPTASATYTLTATGTGGVTYTASFDLTYNQLTAPVILGFEATSLPSPDGVEPDKVRLHWAATAGDFPTAVEGRLTYGAEGLLEFTDLRGFRDIPAAEATDLKLRFTNVIGSDELEAAPPAPDTAHSAVIRAANPVAWYRFNESVSSGLVVDSAGRGAPHDGVLRNHIAVNLGARGFLDGAGTFSAAGAILTDRIIDPNDEALVGFTVEAIIETNPGNGTANRVLVSQQDTPPYTGRQILSVDDTGTVRSNVGGGTTISSTGKVPARAWSHLVGVVDLDVNLVSWYIDGQPAGTGKPEKFFEPSQGAWVIGSAKGLDGSFWRGKIDDLIIYDRILDESEILAHRNAWWNRTTGLLHSSISSTAINAGESAQLALRVGKDITSVTIDNGVGVVATTDGNAVVSLTPGVTTTYTITLDGPNGPVTTTYTITVTGGTVPLEIVSHRIEGGSFIIHFRGAPSTTYAVRGSTDLISFGTDLGTSATDGEGNGTATITIDAGNPAEFYRIETVN